MRGGERTASPVLMRTPARGKQLGGWRQPPAPSFVIGLAVGIGPQGMERGKKVGGGTELGKPPPPHGQPRDRTTTATEITGYYRLFDG